ncbi:hypothetical protein M0208_16670 [Sphingomonas sp. SUN019]|uniref:hypothetical protein n=1 Tax=Sphingomonas sp. SUN019 TaxID=2937788 RepID=UPI002164ADC5|nr:hypothetical protein [Sphingomonas sp. SUN019]UVO52065.1 hypothetical protein M0208_16670 [Sphingomonas sp. SUN019]
MTRFWPGLMLLAIAQPAWAGDSDAPYYGPMKRWHGIGYKFGYQDRTEKDGSWRIDAAIHGRGDAINMALYRAAERARAEGYRYIFFLGGEGSKSPGMDAATVYARPSHEGVPPLGCRSKKITSCYTADVAEVLRILGGPGGTQPGVPIVDHRDQFGREVFLSGYGTGGVATLLPGGMVRSHVATIVENRSNSNPAANPRVAPIPALMTAAPERVTAGAATPIPVNAAVAPRGTAVPIANSRLEQALKANQPVRGREPNLGWTISD